MNEIALIFAAFFGATAIIFGALLILGFEFTTNTSLSNYIFLAFIIGTFLFSFSIYGLVISSAINKKLSFLGPVTPLGGLFLVLGWGLLIYKFIL